jgi:hypothetical protein
LYHARAELPTLGPAGFREGEQRRPASLQRACIDPAAQMRRLQLLQAASKSTSMRPRRQASASSIK